MGRRTDQARPILTLNLLGPPDLRLGDRPFPPLPSRKALALLVYLSVESSRIHDRRLLASLFWPDSPEEKALGSLRQSLLALRRTLGDDRFSPAFLEADSRTVRFNPSAPHRLDLALFDSPAPECRVLEDPEACSRCARHLAAATEAIRGGFLEGFDLPGCEEFDGWVEGMRERTRTLAVRSVERLVRFFERTGELPEAIRTATRGLRIDPYDEGGHRRLMRLLTASGDPRAAELQFEACRNLLVRDLGVPPEPETMALLREIREGRTRWENRPSPSDGCPECRPATVLFFDGLPDAPSTGEESLSPELRQTLEKVPEFISGRGGVSIPSHGGTRLAWFGLGPSREGAARRAARTALELSELFRREAGVSVRAGLHAGTVVSRGELLHESSGSVERIAMALCMQAETGDLLVSKSAVSLLAGQFSLDPADGLRLPPGVGGAFRLRGIADSPSLEEVLKEPLPVGRNAELELFASRWESDEGGVLLLEGPPGIGKSRLVRAFIARALAGRSARSDALPIQIRRLECLPQFSDSPFYPVVRFMRNLIGLPIGEDPELSRKKIREYVLSVGLAAPRKTAVLLADLLGLPPDDASVLAPVGLDRREAFESILVAILRRRSRNRFLLLIEDLHWADDSTRQILRKILEDPAISRRITTVLTVRSGEAPSWLEGLEGVRKCPIGPLSSEESRSLVRLFLKDRPVTPEQEEDIVRTAGGVPLFLEVMSRRYLESPEKGGGLSGGAPLPQTLTELLSARLALYPEDRALFQRAALIGRVIPLDLFLAVTPASSETVTRFLRRAEERGLLVRKPDSVDEAWEFTHALLQEAAVFSIVPAERESIHRTLAETLASRFPHIAETTPEILARHFEGGHLPEKAAEWYEVASRQAYLRGSFQEAKRLVDAALRTLRTDPAVQGDREGLLLLLLGQIMSEIKGLGNPEVRKVFLEARTHFRTGSTSPEAFLARNAQFRSRLATAELGEAASLAETLEKTASRTRSHSFRSIAGFARGTLAFWMGDFERSRESLAALGENPEEEAHSLLLRQSLECCRQGAAYRAWALWFLGREEECRAELARILKWAREENSPLQGFFQTFACNLYRYLGDVEAVLEKTEALLASASRDRTAAWVPTGRAFQGWAMSRQGKPGGISMILESLPMWRSVHRVAENVLLSLLSEAYLLQGDTRRSRGVAEGALRFSGRTGTRFYDAELWRIRGECALREGEPLQARRDFRRAWEIARNQGARAIEERAKAAFRQLGPLEEEFVIPS